MLPQFIKDWLSNYKTTFAGIAAIAGAVGLLFTELSSESPTVEGIWTAVLAISAGFGLLFARDSKPDDRSLPPQNSPPVEPPISTDR